MVLDKKPSWIDNASKLTGESFKNIFIFTVINCPVGEKSARAIILPEDTTIPIEYKVAENADNMDSILEENNLISFPPTGDYFEKAVFVKSKNSVVVTFIEHIRNSIAHGRFNIVKNGRENILVLEDINKRNKCSARIIVKAKTLDDWIDDITNH